MYKYTYLHPFTACISYLGGMAMKKESLFDKRTVEMKNNLTKKEYKHVTNSFDSSLKSHSIMDQNRKGRIHAFSTLSSK